MSVPTLLSLHNLTPHSFPAQSDLRCKGDVEGKDGPCGNCRSADVECKKATKPVKFKNPNKAKHPSRFAREQPWVRTGANLHFCHETVKIAAPPERSSSAHLVPPTKHFAAPSPPVVSQPAASPPAAIIGLQEACLIRHFTAKLAPSFDATDRDNHYTLTVPHRALTSPVLLYALCTVSSRLLTSRWYNKHPKPTVVSYHGVPLPELDEHSAIHYHNACLRLLMDFADIPADEANAEARADALAATTMLRTYEQLDTSLTGLDAEVYQSVVSTVMSKHHDRSIYSLDNMDKNNRDAHGMLIPAEGLRTSACLVALRQEIWSVVMYRRSLRLPLAEGMDYSCLGSTDDFTWANRVILWCADVLRFCFGSSVHQAETQRDTDAHQTWTALKVFDDQWLADTPSYFRPLYTCPARPESSECFPTIWQSSHAHVVAIQHLHLGRMLLAMHNPLCAHLGHDSSSTSPAVKQQVRESVKVMCGLALGDRHYQAGMTTAAIGISIASALFEDKREQHAIVRLLETLEEEHAWPTKSMVESIWKAWRMDHTLRSGGTACGFVVA
ncbi:hypothetical protein SVAN01_07699 [Stagonosporopsis vannaccii]|nr:hypothetical protein SVAN01_07699 [Stagonosporopsis vannaccii]